MIRAGREVLDRHGVGELHGLSASAALRRRPWARPGHPAPVNEPGGRKGGLWDREQAAAYAAGEPVPSLPSVDDPGDLLDVSEAADVAGIKAVTWTRYAERERGLVPEPDAVLFGQPHYRRDSLAEWLPNRPGRAAGAGRRAKNGMTEAELRERVSEMLGEAEAAGREISAREVARTVGVSPTKASRLVGAVKQGGG